MIVGSKAEEEEYKNYLQAFRSLGADPFLSLSFLDMKDADSVVLPRKPARYESCIVGRRNQHANDVSNELDQIQWDIRETGNPQKKPILGICRGIQFINVYFEVPWCRIFRVEKSTRLLIRKFSSSAQCKKMDSCGNFTGNLPSKTADIIRV